VRLERNLVFEAIAERFTDIRLAPRADIAYKPTQSRRGLRSLPVVLRPAGGSSPHRLVPDL